MSVQSQQKNMQVIHHLISQDLGYIFGERESGPNRVKKVFLTKSAAFLRALSKDLGLKEMKIIANPGGIAVSGDVTLMGMWNKDNGIYLQISKLVTQPPMFLYRKITSIKDYSGGYNQWLPCSLFETGEYEKLIEILMLKRSQGADKYVA